MIKKNITIIEMFPTSIDDEINDQVASNKSTHGAKGFFCRRHAQNLPPTPPTPTTSKSNLPPSPIERMNENCCSRVSEHSHCMSSLSHTHIS